MAKLINEIGNTYGYLTVIERAKNIDGRARWLCKCKCGNEIIATGKLLRNGKVKSCGCLKKEKLIQRNIENAGNIEGKRFGKLIAKKYLYDIDRKNGHKDRVWLCQCDCGNTTEVVTRYLKSGDVSSCGCSNSKGNSLITRLLNQYHIKYNTEYTFNNFVTPNGGNYRYDFALFDNDNNLKCLIEYQGSIHFKNGTGWNTDKNLQQVQKRDKEKFDFCKENGIKLYYITYKDDIEEKLKEILNEQYDSNC